MHTMFRLSNCVFVILNIVMLIFGIATILSSVYLSLTESPTECQKVLQTPFLIVGAFTVVLSLLGLMGSFYRLTFVLWIYSLVAFVLVLGTLVFIILVFSVINKQVSKVLSEMRYKDYKFEDHAIWLENHFVIGKNWEKTKSCLIDAQICRSLGSDHGITQDAAEFYKMKLSSIQGGCCRPPNYCGFEFKNATFWIKPKSGRVGEEPDCTTWSNVQDKLCYDCKSCKGGVLDNIRKDWRTLETYNSCVLAFILIIYSTSCCTRRNIKYSCKTYSFYNNRGFYA